VAQPEHAEPRRGLSLALVLAGALGLVLGAAAGPQTLLIAGLVFVTLCVVAVRDSAVPVFTWPNALTALVVVIWLVPIRLYTLPIDLPFNLEFYRLFLLVLVLAWAAAGMAGRETVNTVGHGRPVALLAVGAIVTQIVYLQELPGGPLEVEAIKTLSYFLSFLLVFLLFASVVKDARDIERMLRTLVIGGMVVALAALWESRTNYNLFSELDRWLPLQREAREIDQVRGGRARVFASAQHPIALGCALVLIVPLALYLAQNAVTAARRRLWLVATVVIGTGALTTISRTTVMMIVVMAAVGLMLRAHLIVRYWPLLLVLPFVVHFVAPGALGGLYKSFFPKQGLVANLNERAGQGGSGRFADIGPGLDLWAESPVVGKGLGSLSAPQELGPTARGEGRAGATIQDTELIFDNQYMNTFVTMGLIGIVGAIWFIWGAAVKLGSAAKETRGPPGDLIAACSVSCAGFGASLIFFDAFSFVQATLVFCIVAALGLRLRDLTQSQTAPA
jgi:polysaccharide biosynthesis protein PslJ